MKLFSTVIIRKKILHLIVAVTMILTLTSCAYLPLSEPENGEEIITADDLTPPTTVEDIIETAESDGVNYNYFWLAEDVDAFIELFFAENGYEDADDDYKKALEDEAERARDHLTQEHNLPHVVSPQEAANIAAALANKAYGIVLDETSTVIVDLIQQKDDGRILWHADVMANENSNSYVIAEIDATTAQYSNYVTGHVAFASTEQFLEEISSTTPAACYVVTVDHENGILNGYWDTEHSEYAMAMQSLKDELSAALVSGGIVREPVSITDITIVHEPQEHTDIDVRVERTLFNVALSDGKTITAERNMPYDAYTSYNYGGYPLYGYSLIIE